MTHLTNILMNLYKAYIHELLKENVLYFINLLNSFLILLSIDDMQEIQEKCF